VGFFDLGRLSLPMSGFDEEAERQRLREKYEQDQEKRATTQRMSELLLKGATMTNRHCDTCGDPIFRYDGQEFCPTCRAAEGAPTEQETTEEADTQAETAAPAAGADADVGAETAADTKPAPEAAPNHRTPSSTGGDAPADVNDGRIRDPVEDATTPRSPRRSSPGGASLDDARASLSRTLVRYAQAAEETDDPRRATELLAAAREAAEALSALDRR
jgi:uncharacterized Zn finger protein (UPF0148 family)